MVPVINPIDQLLNIRHRIDGNGELIQDSINDHFNSRKLSMRTHEQVVRRQEFDDKERKMRAIAFA